MVESGRTRQGRVDVIPPPRGIFDIRADSLTPKVLYLASGVDEHGKVNSAFVCVVEKHLSYSYLGDIDKIEEDIGYGTCQTNDFVKTIFWNNSPDLQLDEQAAVDASWAAESIDVAKDLKRFVTSDNVFNLPFDQAVANVNRFTTSPHKIRTLDLAAGVGGNLVYFGLNSDLTVGVELNPDRLSICKNNVNVFGLQNTHVVEQDLFDYIKQFADDPLDKAKEIGVEEYFHQSQQYDIVHISPPWGGKSYMGSIKDEIFKLQGIFDIESAMHGMSRIGNIVTIYLPRSQSLNELVRLAGIGNYPIIIITAYRLPKKVRCIHAHFVKDVEYLKYVEIHHMERTHVSYKQVANALNTLIHSTPYQSSNVNMASEMHMNYVLHAIMKYIDEKTPAVAMKIYNLLGHMPLGDILSLANEAKEIQLAGGMTKLNSEETRTTGGIFFHLLKSQNRQLYKLVESLSSTK